MKVLLLLLLTMSTGWGQAAPEAEKSTYTLGPGDQILIRVLDMDEMSKDLFQIDMRGNITLPMAGRIHASGMTVSELEEVIASKLKAMIKEPEVTVTLKEMRSQPVSVLGSVKNPGVHQLQGTKSLLEVISLAGGLNPDAGYNIRITRKREWGKLPIADAKEDASGQYYVAEVGVKEILEALAPEKNIPVKPYDVITVPKGNLVYVMGAVKKSGGFILGDREKTTVLEALSMAEGAAPFAQYGKTKILRKTNEPERRLEIAVQLDKILSGEMRDIPMERDDILYVPTSATKKALARTAEAAISIGTGVAIYRR